MKKHLIAAAALATLSNLALAQSVTAYGTIDLGYRSSSTSTTQGNVKELFSGNIAPSVIGFKGSEDLGGGLKAGFALESHLDPSNGTRADLGATNQLFARQANLSLSSNSLGTVTLGRQFTAGVLAFAATDPRGLRESGSGLQMWAGSANTTTITSAHAGIFASNAVGYSVGLNGVTLAVTHAFGEVAGDNSRNTLTSFGATYAGPVTVSASFETTKKDAAGAGKDTERFTLGVGYTLGALTLKANMIDADHKAATTKDKIYGFGGDYKVSAAGTITAATYMSERKSGANKYDADNYVVGYEHALSKRTTLFAQHISTKQNDATVAVALVGGAANKSSRTTAAGIKHSF